jgi:hypothetical protein
VCHEVAVIDGIDPPSNAGEDKGWRVAAKPCPKTTWCIEDDGHGGACVEVPRAPIARTDHGPRSRR